MHRMLQIPEVLLSIFRHCVSSGSDDEDLKIVSHDLAALARTCRAFKEPALDMLWSELQDPTHLLWCLPETSYQKVTKICQRLYTLRVFYTFTRPLKRAEWDIFRSYARRVRCMKHYMAEAGLDWEFVRRTSTDFTPTDPLFPSLQSLSCDFTTETTPLLQLPFPSLVRLFLGLSLRDLRTLQGPLMSLAKTSPNIKNLDFWRFGPKLAYTEVISDGIHGWSNLQSLACPGICLNADSFMHLSRMPALASLVCMLSTTFLVQTIPSDSPSFTALSSFTLHAESLVSISRLLSWAKLPLITHFTLTIESCPLKMDLASFMDGLQVAGIGHKLQSFSLRQEHVALETTPFRGLDAPLLGFDDLRPCTTFHNLRYMDLDLWWDVDLPDDKLLTLASAWPLLEVFSVNTNWGWNRPGGITPKGLASLLQMCPSLNRIALAIDTRGYTKSPDGASRKPSPSPFPKQLQINVLDSIIEEESVNPMAVFLSTIVPHFNFIFTARNTRFLLDHSGLDLYQGRWKDVYRQANEAVEGHWIDLDRGEVFWF